MHNFPYSVILLRYISIDKALPCKDYILLPHNVILHVGDITPFNHTFDHMK